MAGFGGLAGFIAGNPSQAYDDARMRSQRVQQGDVDAAAQAAAGNAYQSMFNAQVPGATPTQQQGQGLLQTILSRIQGLTGAPQPQGGMPAPMASNPPGATAAAVPGARPMQPPMAQGAPGQPPPMGGQPPMGPQPGAPPMGGQPPQGGGQPQPGALTWQSVVQQVVRANPGVKDPRVIAAAVDRFIPLMNAQSLQEWRQQSLGIRQGQLQQGQERIDQGGERVKQGEERIDVSRDKEKAIQGRFDAKMAAQQDRQAQTLQMQRERLEAQIKANKDKTMLGQWRALLDAERARMQATIGATGGQGLSGPEGKKQLDEMNKYYDDKIREMKAFMEGGQQGGMTGPGESIIGGGSATPDKKPVKVNGPDDIKKLPSGTPWTSADGSRSGVAP